MTRIRAIAMAGAALAVSACASRVVPEPERPPVRSAPVPAPTPTPPPPPQPQVGWEDMALTPGDWVYREDGPSAVYGAGLFTLRCDPAARRVLLVRSAAGGALTVRTSYGARTLPGGASGAALPANDAFLEQIVFSRGRIAVEAEGQARLVLPTWAEPARVVEECKG